MKKQIFRQVSLERLSSPEELDTLMQVTTPKGWLALIGLGLLMTTALIWGIFASLPTRVNGGGILIRTGGVERILSRGSGQITEIYVDVSDIVKEGQTIARISQPELVQQIENTKDSLDELLALKTFLPTLQGQLRHQTRGITTNPQELLSIEQRINETQRELRLLDEKLSTTASVTSPYTGRVLEMMVDAGNAVNLNDTILSVELLDGDDEENPGGHKGSPLEAVIYVSAVDGKKVRPGMEVAITPSTVKKEEFGSLLATVTSVADFPSTQRGMMRVLENETLVQQLSAGMAPIELHATLTIDAETSSGYRWSSSKGPDTMIYSGTLVTASIKVREQRPISLVLPLLKKKLGV